MNESDLENELRALRPAAPSAALETRIADELAALSAGGQAVPARARESLLAQILRPLLWASIGATAAVIVMTARQQNLPAPGMQIPQSETVEFAPPETTRELLSTEQSGVRYEAERGPVREVRASYLEHHAWTDPRTGGRVEIAVPRQDVFLQPIAMQ